MLNEGDKAPSFNMPTNKGENVSLSKLKGQKIVLYFYPRDDTPGCTKEACGFRDDLSKYKRAGAVVIGVSRDSVESHEKFVKKFDLNFMLASDKEGDVCEKYDAWRMKNMYGKEYMGIGRSTFLIDTKGKINKIWPKVKVDGHVDEVLKAVKECP
ncbi:MAG: thioredoxin-dependent thiol peroxidase [Thaumarchaeota archaeon]|nr:thioredoxin-dependent thiol peroxidase [Nitrososphaerota archaeon]|tara:strand:+ start:40 stop:504 length:465 start_codon:yes stop_codon:yes gene_type:complete